MHRDDVGRFRAERRQNALGVVALHPALQKTRRHRQIGRALLHGVEFEPVEPGVEHILPQFRPQAAAGARPGFGIIGQLLKRALLGHRADLWKKKDSGSAAGTGPTRGQENRSGRSGALGRGAQMLRFAHAQERRTAGGPAPDTRCREHSFSDFRHGLSSPPISTSLVRQLKTQRTWMNAGNRKIASNKTRARSTTHRASDMNRSTRNDCDTYDY